MTKYDAILVAEFNGPQRGQTRRLWRIDGHRIPFVVTSKVRNEQVHETYVFRTSPGGTVTNWDEMPGSQRGEVSHETAIAAYLAHINGRR